jgi:hypothetical protein
MISHGPEKRQLTGLTEVLAPFTMSAPDGVEGVEEHVRHFFIIHAQLIPLGH